MGMVYYALYYSWRHAGVLCNPFYLCLRLDASVGGHHNGATFVLWILCGILYALYASAWVRAITLF
jgi:hypothetical protein